MYDTLHTPFTAAHLLKDPPPQPTSPNALGMYSTYVLAANAHRNRHKDMLLSCVSVIRLNDKLSHHSHTRRTPTSFRLQCRPFPSHTFSAAPIMCMWQWNRLVRALVCLWRYARVRSWMCVCTCVRGSCVCGVRVCVLCAGVADAMPPRLCFVVTIIQPSSLPSLHLCMLGIRNH